MNLTQDQINQKVASLSIPDGKHFILAGIVDNDGIEFDAILKIADNMEVHSTFERTWSGEVTEGATLKLVW